MSALATLRIVDCGVALAAIPPSADNMKCSTESPIDHD
jgi:hypothetical protein